MILEQREITESEYWRERVAGPGPYKIPLINEFPQAGFFRTRMVKGGPLVPCRIWLIETFDPETGDLMADTECKAEVNGKEEDAYRIWSYCADKPITEAEYRFMRSEAAWAKANAPSEPISNPTVAVDWMTAPPAF